MKSKLYKLSINGKLSAAIVVVFALSCAQVTAQDAIDVAITYKKGDYHQVKMQFHHLGDVVINDFEDDEAIQKMYPLNVNAQITFGQRFTGTADKPQAIRHYAQPKAEIKIKTEKAKSQLNDRNRWVIARHKEGERIQMASIADVLSQNELDLIRNPADPITFGMLLNKKNVRLNEKWNVPSQALTAFLAVDRVYDNDIQIVLKEFDDETSKVYIMGSVKAEVDDIETSMEISGVAMIDRTRNCVTALRTSIREKRQAGQIAPGFEGQTKIDLRMEPVASIKELSNQTLTSLTKTLKIERRLKWESSIGGFKVVYDPRWRVIAAEDDAAVMRFLDEGELLAQCNIVQLDSLPPESPLTLKAYKNYVENMISKNEAAKISDVKQLTTSAGNSALKVAVNGVEEGLPVQWIYYHVGNKDGRRLTFIFTLEKEVASVFGKADEALVNDLEFYAVNSKASKNVRSSAINNQTRK